MAKTKEYCVYAHINTFNRKVYVGISKNPIQRWGRNGIGYKGSVLGNAIQKYGWDNFEHIILETDLTRKEAGFLERLYIISLDAKVPNGYNVCDGGEGAYGFHFSEEQRKMISKKMLGKKLSKETRKKLSESKRGVKFSEEHKNALSVAIKQMIKRKIENGERLPAKRKSVLQFDKRGNFIQRFDSADEAARYLNISHINDVCYGRRKSAGGYIWKWEEEYNGAY